MPKRAGSRPARPGRGRDLALVLGIALSLRVLHWLLYARTPFFAHPVVDASFFDLWARAIAAGREFQPDVYFKPPLYPYLLAGVYRLAGAGPTTVYALQTALGVACCLLVLAIGRQIFPPRAALAGAMICAALPILPFFELQLLAETVTTFLSLLALWWLLRARGADGAWRRPPLALAGLALGVAAVGRPNILLLLPLFAWWLWRGTAARRPQPATIFLCAGLLALLPTTARNAHVGRVLVPVSANFGANLWTGAHPGADGVSAVPVGLLWDDLKLRCREVGAGSAAASSRYLTGVALRDIAAEPGRALALLGKKLAVLVNAQEPRNNIGAAYLAREHGVVTLSRWWPSFWIFGPFMLLGIFWPGLGKPLPLPAAQAGRRLLLLYLAGMVVSVLPFFVNDRFRMPLLPVAALFAGAAAVGLLERRRRRLPPLLALLVVFAAVNIDWFRLGDPRHDARDHFNLALILSSSASGPESLREAERHYQRAMQLDPADPDYPERYGQVLLQLAQPRLARAEQLAAANPTAAANLYEACEPMIARAQQLHRQAAALFPRSYQSHANLATTYLWQGDAAALGAAAASDPAPLLARARHLYDEAAAAYRRALGINPALRAASDNLKLLERRQRDLWPERSQS